MHGHSGHLGTKLFLLPLLPMEVPRSRGAKRGFLLQSGQLVRRGMDPAFLYSVYWNLFNVSLVWTDSHVTPGGGTWDTVQQQAIGRLDTGCCVVNTPSVKEKGSRGQTGLGPQPAFLLTPAFLSLSIFCPLLSSSFPVPLSHGLPPPSFSLVFVQNNLSVLSI